MPMVFSQFDMVINTMREKTEFDSFETDYIVAVTDCIQSTASAVPEMFTDHIDQIMQSFLFIAQRTVNSSDTHCYSEVMKCVDQLCMDFNYKPEFVEEIYQMLMTTIKQDSIKFIHTPDAEGDVDIDTNLQNI